MDLVLEIGLSNAVAALALALLAFGIGRISRRPAVVHGLWLLVLIKLITPPLFWIPVVTLPAESTTELAVDGSNASTEIQPSPAPPLAVAAGDDVAAIEQVAAETRRADLETPTVEPARPAADSVTAALPSATATVGWRNWFSNNWRAGLGGLWAAGALCWLGLVIVRLDRFHRLLRHAAPAPADLQASAACVAQRLGLARCPEVRLIPGPVSPLLWTMGGRPRLLLPTDLLKRLGERQVESLLAHELAHYRRGDHWVRWLELVVNCLYWWHPVVWLAKKKLREAEEQCCDAWVVWALPSAARSYAEALLETVDFLAEVQPLLPIGASGLGEVSDLKRRVTMIMKGNTPRTLTWAGTLGLLGLAAALVPWLPTWAQDRAPQPPGGGDERRERGRPDAERQGQIEDTRQAIQKMAEQMRQLQEQMERAQRRLAELEGRPAGPGRGGFGMSGQFGRRPGGAEDRPNQPNVPPGGFGPGGPGFPGNGAPGPQPGAPGGFGPGGMPGMPPPGAMGGDVNRRLEELERKMERIMQMMESMQRGGRGEPSRNRSPRGDGDGERREPAPVPSRAPAPVAPPPAATTPPPPTPGDPGRRDEATTASTPGALPAPAPERR